MKVLCSIIIVICMLLSIGVHAQNTKEKSSHPNIVMIFIDDWAWNGTPVPMDDSMPNSGMPLLQMPNLEKLAEQGMKFQNAYSGAPQCSPSRVALQTGQSSPRNGFTVYMNSGGQKYYNESKKYSRFPVVPNVSDETIDADATTIPETLKPLGYACAHLGKWHMRGNPGDEGYLVHDGSTSNSQGNSKIPDDPKLMFSITSKAVDFMEAQVKMDTPFYLQISHYAMHEGRECLMKTREKYAKCNEVQEYYKKLGKSPNVKVSYEEGPKDKFTISASQDPAVWLGMGEDLDGRIGVVLDKIKELGIEDNTYVIVAADNGYRHKFYPNLKQPLHMQKWWIWQGGIRVPMVVKGPGITAGSVFKGNVVNYDFLPTFYEWAGGIPAELKNIDGISLAPYMAGEKPGEDFLNRNLYFHYPHYRSTVPHSAIISGTKKVLHFYERPDIPLLFDLSEDVGEVHNIARENPKEHQALYKEMMEYLNKVGARIPKKNPNYIPEAYERDREYYKRKGGLPFEGSRKLAEDER